MTSKTISVKIDKKTNKYVESFAIHENKSKSDVIRDAINEYIDRNFPNAGDFLLATAADAKKKKYKAPKDVVENHDKYIYGN